MQKPSHISLNAIRIFACAAQYESIAQAAQYLGVTPSAVSHQIKNLELALGISLFKRRNNAITLTDIGKRFLTDCTPGLHILAQATDTIVRDANMLCLRVSTTLATRWLIPALDRFKARHPQAQISIQTSAIDDMDLGPSADLAITYRRADEDIGKAELLLPDLCRPVLSPGLMQATTYQSRADIGAVPAITCTDNNWDWAFWANQMGLAMGELRFADHFDIDDAALRAATAGLGMVLAPELLIRAELDAGTLVPLPGFEPIELGAFYLVTGPRTGGIVRSFCNWLRAELATLP